VVEDGGDDFQGIVSWWRPTGTFQALATSGRRRGGGGAEGLGWLGLVRHGLPHAELEANFTSQRGLPVRANGLGGIPFPRGGCSSDSGSLRANAVGE
jgi:hypothetical protein